MGPSGPWRALSKRPHEVGNVFLQPPWALAKGADLGDIVLLLTKMDLTKFRTP